MCRDFDDVTVVDIDDENKQSSSTRYSHYIFDILNCIFGESEPEYYDDDPALPIYECISSKCRRLCSSVPTFISSSVEFVVDTNRLQDKNDLLCDDIGVWKRSAVDTGKYVVKTLNGEVMSTVKSSSDEALCIACTWYLQQPQKVNSYYIQ